MKKNNQAPDWNREKSWDKIEQRLEKKKRRPFIFWWFTSVAVLLLIGVLVNNELVDQLISKSINQEISEPVVSLNETVVVQNIEPTNETTVQKKVEELTQSNIKKSNLNKTAEGRIENNFIAPRFSEETFIGDETALAEHTSSFAAKANSDVNLDTRLKSGAMYRIPSTSIFNSEKSSIKSKLESISFLPFEKAQLFYTNEDLKLPNQLLIESPIFKKENQSKPNQWLWFVESGFDVGNVKYNGVNDYSTRKSDTEYFRFTSTSTFGFEKEFSKNWYLKSGITFQTIFEKYDGTAVSTNEADVFRDSAFYYELNDGQIYYEPGLVSETTTFSRQIVKNNFLYRLSLPVTFGKKFNFGKTQLAADLGVKPQFYQHFSGIVADEDYFHLFDNQIINSTYYSNDFDLGLLANLSARYALTPSTQIGIGLRYEKEVFLNLRKEDFMSRYQMVGGYLGVYRKF